MMTTLDRVGIAGRVFTLAAITGVALLTRDGQTGLGLLVLAMLAGSAVFLTLTSSAARWAILTVEAAVTSVLVLLSLPGGVALLPYLVVAALLAGLAGGTAAVGALAVAELVVFAVGVPLVLGIEARHGAYQLLSPWLLTTCGTGVFGAWVRSSGRLYQGNAAQDSYETARRLLFQLRTVARRLPSGLDPLTIAHQIISTVQAQADTDHLAVFIITADDELAPHAYSTDAARNLLTVPPPAAADAVRTRKVMWEDTDAQSNVLVCPLRVAEQSIGVVVAMCADSPSARALKILMQALDELAPRLDTAMVFDEVRSVATAEERRRLAREIHDGVAQEVVSLGYQVDTLLAEAESEQQAESLAALRGDLTRVTNELRLSIYDLRSDVLAETGLCAALSDYLRQVSSRSALKVHLTLDETASRLRPDVEAELLRIAQEAVTNARKHSGARNLWVSCLADAPSARVEVRDDGSGLGRGRSDSYGLRIMRERAERVGADLWIGPSDEGTGMGTCVRVSLGNVSWHDDIESENQDDYDRNGHRLVGGRP
jgi:signal transduction histidine kinase